MHKLRNSLLILTSFALGLSIVAFGNDTKNSLPSAGVFDCKADGTAEQAVASYIPTDTEYLTYKAENGSSFHDYVGNIYDVWDNYQGDGIRVAVIDSGIDTDHPDFYDEDGNSIIDYDSAVFITHVKSTTPVDNKFTRSRDNNGNLTSGGYILRFYTNTEGSTFSIDGESIPIREVISHWDGVQGTHGTSVSSTIASYAHDTSHVGTIGIAPKVTLVPIKVDFFADTIGAALRYVHELNTNSNPDDDIDVVNMSIEATSTYSTYPNSISTNAKSCTEDGTILFASGGNHNTTTKYYPASDPYIIGVGALDKFSFNTKADYSNYNSSFNTNWQNNVDITMVGNVYVAEDGGTYKEIQGTSFSSPICAAAAALWKQKYPNKTYNNFLTDLVAACVDIGATGNDNVFGYGRLSIDKLLSAPSTISIDNVPNKELELEVGDTFQLEHSFVPADYDGDVEYTTYYDEIISVSNTGLITALAEGNDVVSINPVRYSYINDEITVTVVPSSTPEPETETFDITFGNATSTGSDELHDTNIVSTLSAGSTYVSSFSDLSKVYGDEGRLKIGSGSAIGKFTVNLSASISSLDCKSITISASKYSDDTGKIKLSANGSVLSSDLNPSNETLTYTFNTPIKVSSIKIETTAKRAYINGISIECIKQGSTPSTKTLSSITLSGQTTSLTVGSNFTFGGTVTAHYSDNSTANVTSSTTFSGYNMNVANTYTVTASYTENSVTATATYTLTVSTSGGNDYYSSIGSDLTGNSLKSALNTLNNNKRGTLPGYDGLKNLYKNTDVDPNGSGKILGFYDNELIGPDWDSGKTWNREHVWPDSLGGNKVEGDAHMPRPTKISSNGDRGNLYYGLESSGLYDPGCLGYENYRGIAARIIFYCAIADTSLSIIDSNSGNSTQMGKLSKLLEWNLQYQPTTSQTAAVELRAEQHRNEYIYSSTTQHNRNPFIDHPEYACKIWGNTNATTKQICGIDAEKTLTSITLSGQTTTYDVGDAFSFDGTVTAHYSDGSSKPVTPTSVSSPTMTSGGTQKITVSYTEGTVTKTAEYNITIRAYVNSFSLDKNSISLDYYKNKSTTLTPTISADPGATTTITWSTNPTGVVQVTGNGPSYTVTALKAGSTTITATCGGKTATCSVSVSIQTQSISISGSTFVQTGGSTTLTASVYPVDALDKSVEWSASPAGVFALTPNDSNNTVSLTPIGSVGQSATITATAKDGSSVYGTYEVSITEAPPTIESFTLNVPADRKVPFGQYRTAASMQLKVHYSNETDAIISEGATITAEGRSNLLLLGDVSIKIQYNEITVKENIYITNFGSKSYVGINSKAGTRAAGQYNATPEEQAVAWSEYFIKQTGGGSYSGPCKLDKDLRAGALQDVWEDIENEYVWMADASKDVFVDNSGNNSLIADAQEHYRHICKTYGLTQFVVDGDDKSMPLSNRRNMFKKTFDDSSIIIISFVLVGMLAFSVYFIYRKRRVN